MYVCTEDSDTHTLYILRVCNRDTLAAGSSLFRGPGAKAPAHCSLEPLTWGALWGSEKSQRAAPRRGPTAPRGGAPSLRLEGEAGRVEFKQSEDWNLSWRRGAF